MIESAKPSSISWKDFSSLLNPRAREAHKGDFGHVLVVGGDYGMGGAVRLAGEAALRTGAGLVTLATRKEHAFAICAARPELMCKGVESSEDLEPLLNRATTVVVGPGLGKEKWGRVLLDCVLQSHLPLVIDADALNILSENPKLLTDKVQPSVSQNPKPMNWVLTPHVGEAARLLQFSTADIQKNRMLSIQTLKKYYEGTIVLKGAGTLVLGEETIPDICLAGNPGMASPGMGDVLSGMIAAFIAQGFALHQAARLAVCLHAEAGDIAAKKGESGMIASDLINALRPCLNLNSIR